MRSLTSILIGGVVAALATAALVVWWAVPGSSSPGNGADTSRDRTDRSDRSEYAAGPETSARPGEVMLPVDAAVTCPAPTVHVRTAEELTAALAAAGPGTVIALRDGTYSGNFTGTAVGSPEAPIFICGSREAVLDAGGPKEGYVLHLDGAQCWRVVGFTVSNGQKGVMADGVVGSVIQQLHVTGTGDEAIHLRRFSSDNVVRGNEVDTTGLRRDKFGEGIYVGTAVSNWCTISDCRPDRSDRNVVVGNRISNTGSESVDIKEGTTGGAVRGNTFDGAGMTGADSWVDIKGNAWVIEGNTGTRSPLDGFQTHQILDDWGDWNLFRGNTADVQGDGFGYALRPVANNVLSCDNNATAAGSGTANTACSPD